MYRNRPTVNNRKEFQHLEEKCDHFMNEIELLRPNKQFTAISMAS